MNITKITLLLLTLWYPLSLFSETLLRGELKYLFSHEKHASILKQEDIQCMDCHVINVVTSKAQEKTAKVFSDMMLSKVGRAACHLCHKNSQARVDAPQQCATCHTPEAPGVKPLTHTANWMDHHGTLAKFEPQSCTQCHQTTGCQKCHTPTGSQIPLRNIHPGNFRHTHSISARINAQKCSTCHAPSYCVTCHERGH